MNASEHAVRGRVARKRLSPMGLIGTLVLAACTVGPRYVRPPVAASPAFQEASPAAYSGAAAGTWRPAQPADARLKGHWWEIFKEPELNALEAQLDINNQNIAEYFQNFMAARAQVREATAGYFPTVTIAPAVNVEHVPSSVQGVYASSPGSGVASGATGTTATGTTGIGTTGTTGTTGNTGSANSGAVGTASSATVFSLPLDASWAPDLWGRVRNEVREYRYAAQVSAADLANERLTEEVTLAEYYFELRGQDALQDLYNRTAQADRQSLTLTQSLQQTGIDDVQDVAQARVTLANAEASAAGLAADRATYQHAIAMLIGKSASSFSMPVKSLSTAVPPIPLGMPSELLERRPDVAAAERTMAEANALIGIATAAYFPSLNLTGGAGFESTRLSALFSAPAWFWSLGASATETVFDAGLRRATVAQYTASFNADVAAYKQTVLTAFQQAEDYIATVRVLSQQIERQQAAVQAAQQYLDIATARYQTGIDPYLDVMSAQTLLLSDQQTEVTERVNELTAAVELIQALGGGWDLRQLPQGAAVAAR